MVCCFGFKASQQKFHFSSIMRFFQVLALTAVLVLPLEAAGLLDTISDKWAARDKLFGTKLSATADSATKIPPIVTQCIDFIDAATTSHVGLEGVYKDSAPEEEMTTKIALIDNVKSTFATAELTVCRTH
jgi:hypothetical protein